MPVMDALTDAWHGRDVDLHAESHAALAAMRGCPQTEAFHGEGDVATHATWVYDLAREHADTFAARAGVEHVGVQAQVLRLAALLHDAGKPETTVDVGPGVWSSRGHDEAGARVVSLLAQTQLLLASLPLGAYVSVHALVRDHMWTYAADRIPPGAAPADDACHRPPPAHGALGR